MLKFVLLYFGPPRKHDLHAYEKAAVTLRAHSVARLAIGRVAIGKYIAGVKDIIDRRVEDHQVAFNAMQFAGLNAHIMHRWRAVFQEFVIVRIVVGPPAGESVGRAEVSLGFFKPFFGNEADVVI